MELGPNTAKIRRVDRPAEEPILVPLDRLRKCPQEIGEEFWPPNRKKQVRKSSRDTASENREVGSTDRATLAEGSSDREAVVSNVSMPKTAAGEVEAPTVTNGEFSMDAPSEQELSGNNSDVRPRTTTVSSGELLNADVVEMMDIDVQNTDLKESLLVKQPTTTPESVQRPTRVDAHIPTSGL